MFLGRNTGRHTVSLVNKRVCYDVGLISATISECGFSDGETNWTDYLLVWVSDTIYKSQIFDLHLMCCSTISKQLRKFFFFRIQNFFYFLFNMTNIYHERNCDNIFNNNNNNMICCSPSTYQTTSVRKQTAPI